MTTLYHARYKQCRAMWEDAYFTTEKAAHDFVQCWKSTGGLAEYKGRRESIRGE